MRADHRVVWRLSWVLILALILSTFGGLAPDVGADGTGGDPPPPGRHPGDSLGDTSGSQNSLPNAYDPSSELSIWEITYLTLEVLL